MSKKNKNYIFRFKQFEVAHAISSIHIGVDAVMIGAWTRFPQTGNILDVGTGCGVIALMAAQKTTDASIMAVDIDPASISEAASNFRNSPWISRLDAKLIDFSVCHEIFSGQFDLIVSNPPYFDSGADADISPRMKARHQSELSPFSLIEKSAELLKPGGRLSIIFPYEFDKKIEKASEYAGFKVVRKCIVRGNKDVPPKRIMIELSLAEHVASVDADELVIETLRGEFTDDYIALCKDFYLKF